MIEVVDLAVEDDPDRLVLVAHGLVARRRAVDDAEPPVGKPDARRRPESAIVGTACQHDVAHPFQHGRIGAVSGAIEDSCDPAHGGPSTLHETPSVAADDITPPRDQRSNHTADPSTTTRCEGGRLRERKGRSDLVRLTRTSRGSCIRSAHYRNSRSASARYSPAALCAGAAGWPSPGMKSCSGGSLESRVSNLVSARTPPASVRTPSATTSFLVPSAVCGHTMTTSFAPQRLLKSSIAVSRARSLLHSLSKEASPSSRASFGTVFTPHPNRIRM